MSQPHVIGVISDTHRLLRPEAVEALQGSELIIHAGDVGIASSLIQGGQALNFAVPVKYGVRLMAKVKPSSVPQPLSELNGSLSGSARFSSPLHIRENARFSPRIGHIDCMPLLHEP